MRRGEIGAAKVRADEDEEVLRERLKGVAEGHAGLRHRSGRRCEADASSPARKAARGPYPNGSNADEGLGLAAELDLFMC